MNFNRYLLAIASHTVSKSLAYGSYFIRRFGLKIVAESLMFWCNKFSKHFYTVKFAVIHGK